MVNSLKDKEEGEDGMCEIMENLMEKRATKVKNEIAKKAIADGELSLEKIAELFDLPLSTVQELASSMHKTKSE